MLNDILPTGNKKTNLLKLNVTELARQLGKSRTWVSLVINGRKKSPQTMAAIAAAIGVPYKDLWGREERE